MRTIYGTIILASAIVVGTAGMSGVAFAAPAEGGLPRGVSWAEPAPGLDYGRIYYYVPEGLDLSKRPGLFIFMHGGGGETKTLPEKYLKPDNMALRPQVDKLGCITVAATAPHARGDHWRWNHPDAEQEILAIIEDVDRKVGIDRDRIILGGQSMGGFGAYHLGLVLADRLAGVWAAAGAWNTADFRALRGTPMFVQHGIFDCAPGYSNESLPRAQYKTGYSFAQAAHEVMERDGVEHVFFPYRGGHGLKWPAAREAVAGFVEWAAGLRRQPYAAAATVVTPCGSEKPCLVRKTRSRWLEVTATVPGTVELDTVELSDYEPAMSWEAYEAQTYRVVKKRLVGFRLQAFNRGDNRFEVVPENVTGFRIHLAAPMGDLGRPFEVDAGPLGKRTLSAIAEAGDKDYCAYLDFEAAGRPPAQPKATVVRPKPTGEILDNPGMGIVIYRQDGMNAYEPLLAPYDTFDWFPGAAVVCLRLPWSVVVPESGDSRWDLIDTYVRAWVAKGRRFALGFTGGTPSDKFFAELSTRYSGDGALAFVQIDAAENRARWKERLAGVPIKTVDDGEQPVLHVSEASRNAVLSLNWKKDEMLAEVEKHRVSYYGVSGFPEISHRNNEERFLAVARRIGYRFELREIEFPDVIVAGSPVRITSEWVNVGVAKCPNPAYVAYSLLDDQGRVVWQWTDVSFDMRTLEPMLEGRERPAKVESVCRFGHDCPPPAPGDAVAARAAERFYIDGSRPVPMLKPGAYRLAVSVGRADGRPEIALPLGGGAENIYPVGKVSVE